MTPPIPATAPTERLTVPLRPRTPAGCCDLAVMFYGRHIAPALRLYVAVAGPAVAFVYGFGRFVGTDVSLAIVTGIVVSKPLGLLTLAAAARSAFGGSFERSIPDDRTRQTRSGRLRQLTRSVLTAAALLAAGVLIVAALDDAYATGRVAALGPRPAAAVVVTLTAIVVLRSGLFVAERHPPGTLVGNGLFLGVLSRMLLAAPFALLFFDGSRAVGYFVAFLWLPIAAGIAMLRSFRSERQALAVIDPALHGPHADKALAFSEMLGPAFVVATATAGLSLVALAAIEFALTTAGFGGPLSGPIADYLDLEFFEVDLAFSALGRSPLFAASSLAAGLLAYQIGRLAWFFAYIDARVRRDCWDMELTLAREAKRLEGE